MLAETMRNLIEHFRIAKTRFLHWRPVCLLRYHAYRLGLSFPHRIACNLCGWRGRRFLDFHDRTILCPQCGSMARHRLCAQALLTLPGLSADHLFGGKRVLHFAAEPCLTSWIKPRTREYFTADLFAAGADLKIDLTDMRDIAPEAFDAFIGFDVLEHVTSDRAALAEIQRILKPGGMAILSVPQRDGLEVTVEDARVNTPELREMTYGQSDHLRLYGRDFEDRVKAAGFQVTVVDHHSFSTDAVKYHVLFPPFPDQTTRVPMTHRRICFCFKTNATP